MSSTVYNIPESLTAAYRGRKIIVRSQNPAALRRRLSKADLANLLYVQLHPAAAGSDASIAQDYEIPLELVLSDPATEFPVLYRYTAPAARFPVRVCVPVVAGFGKAVRLAVALHFPVKLELTQPDEALIAELLQVLDYYLHQSTVSQPIEYFHSLLLAFYHRDSVTLWRIQEEDPALFRYLDDQGREWVSRRFAALAGQDNIDDFPAAFQNRLLAEGSECAECEFFRNCGGYFKWPQKEFRCDGVKILFRTLQNAAEELRDSLRNFHSLNPAE